MIASAFKSGKYGMEDYIIGMMCVFVYGILQNSYNIIIFMRFVYDII